MVALTTQQHDSKTCRVFLNKYGRDTPNLVANSFLPFLCGAVCGLVQVVAGQPAMELLRTLKETSSFLLVDDEAEPSVCGHRHVGPAGKSNGNEFGKRVRTVSHTEHNRVAEL